MNPIWQDFLIARGAGFTNNILQGFNHSSSPVHANESENLLVDLSDLGLVQISGEDSTQFLQNILSNDINAIDSSNSQLSSFCTAKGRMLAIFRIFKYDDSFVLRMPRELIDPISKRLQMYVLMSKVSLRKLDDWVGIGINGPNATAILNDHFKLKLGAPNAVVRHDDISIMRLPGQDRYELFAPIESIKKFWLLAEATLSPAHDKHWRLLDIKNAIPTIYTATSEHFVPQMVNLQQLDGVSFKKGCYPGQEVVARMQYLGKLKRRMYLVQLETDTVPQPGNGIIAVDGEKSHEAGEIVDASLLDGKVLALAVLPIASTKKPLHLTDAAGPRLKLLDLPYALPEPEQQK